MRHRKSFNHLSRKKGHREAMLANMASSLIMHKRIKTTTAKAKALRMYVEPLITKSKNDSTHARRIVFSHLKSKEAVTELFREISPKIADRPGGYTRILKTGFRLGDNADMCIIELVDYNENLLSAKAETAAKTGKRRRRGAKKKAAEELPVADQPVSEIKEAPDEPEAIGEAGEAETQQPEAEMKKDEETEAKQPEAEMKKDEEAETQQPEAEMKKDEETEAKQPEAEMKKDEETEAKQPEAREEKEKKEKKESKDSENKE